MPIQSSDLLDRRLMNVGSRLAIPIGLKDSSGPVSGVELGPLFGKFLWIH